MTDQLAPLPKLQFTDATGAPLAGGKLFTYAAGTTTKLATYTDSTGGTPNTNPIILDARGECSVWLPPGTAYKFVLSPSTDTDPPTNPFWTVDNITAGLATIPGGTDTGSAANVYVVTGVTGITGPTAFQAIVVTVAHTNTGASTLNVNGTGAVAIKDQSGNPLAKNALVAGQPALFIGDGAFWRYQYFTQSFNITDSPSISVTPTGNPSPATLTTMNIQAAAASSTEREWLLCVGLTCAIGAPDTGSATDKVAGYFGIVGNPGTANIWSINSVAQMNAGAGNITMQGYECDWNNDNADPTISITSATPQGYGVSISGAGTYKGTSALLISGPSAPNWYRGILFANFACSDRTIEDQTNSTTFALVEGIHTYGVDFATGATTTAIRLGQAQYIKARNAANNADLQCLAVSGSGATNNMLLGDTGLAGIFSNTGLYPNVTTSYNLGQPANQWETVYCVAVVQSSHPALKTNIQDAPSVLPILDALPVKTYQWKKGGADLVDAEEEQEVQAVEMIETEEEVVEMVGGEARLVKVKRTREHLLFDELPVIGPDGRQVITIVPGKPAVLDGEGKVTMAAIPERRVPRTHKVPRMVRRTVPVKKLVERPGKRFHLGALAPDVRDAFATLGIDLAAFKQDGDDQGYQLDQIVWLAVKGLQEERAARLALETRLAALEARP